jgi:hypothetical protein
VGHSLVRRRGRGRPVARTSKRERERIVNSPCQVPLGTYREITEHKEMRIKGRNK